VAETGLRFCLMTGLRKWQCWIFRCSIAREFVSWNEHEIENSSQNRSYRY